MKILHTISGLAKTSGGPTACTYNLLCGLRRNGVDADVLTLSPNNPDDIIAHDNFIKAVANDADNPLLYSKNIKKYLEETSYDLYHANGLWTYPSHITLKTGEKKGKPVVIAPHGMLYPEGFRSKPWKKYSAFYLFQRTDLKKAACLQATCQQEADIIKGFNLGNHIGIVPNALEIDNNIAPRTDTNSKRVFGFVGRLHPIKNIDVILRVWKSLGNKTADCQLQIVGDGNTEYKKSLMEYVEQNNLNNVIFTGFLSGKSLSDAVNSFDYQLLVSKSENFGMVVPEALINGVPAIATEGTPWQELNSKQCGWWIKDGEDILADTILKAINLPEQERREMGERGREMIITNYSVNAVANKMKRLYSWIISGGEKPDFVI